MMRESGGWDCFRMVPIRQVRCENRLELSIQEEMERERINATLNTVRAYTGRPPSPPTNPERERVNYLKRREQINEMRRQNADYIRLYKQTKPLVKIATA